MFYSCHVEAQLNASCRMPLGVSVVCNMRRRTSTETLTLECVLMAVEYLSELQKLDQKLCLHFSLKNQMQLDELQTCKIHECVSRSKDARQDCVFEIPFAEMHRLGFYLQIDK